MPSPAGDWRRFAVQKVFPLMLLCSRWVAAFHTDFPGAWWCSTGFARLFDNVAELLRTTSTDDGGAVGSRGKMIWMMQGKQEMDLSFLRSANSDAIQVVWGLEPSGNQEDAYFLPNSTCTEGRNFLLQQAFRKGLEQEEQYTYFIYTEDDAELDEIIDFGLSQGNPYRTFEAYLLKYLPAVAFPFNGYGFPDPPTEVVPACWWDHLMVAFHRDAIEALLPYWTGMDHLSWWFAQRIVTVMAAGEFRSSASA